MPFTTLLLAMNTDQSDNYCPSILFPEQISSNEALRFMTTPIQMPNSSVQ